MNHFDINYPGCNRSNLKVCLFGASPGTGNQGVNALCWSTLNGLAERGCTEVDIFAFSKRSYTSAFPGGKNSVNYRVHGMVAGKRVWRANHLWRANLTAILGSRQNSFVRVVEATDAVLDASGGDSFTDLYGAARFGAIIAPKRLALRLGRPLVLLPQTYGPFASARRKSIAKHIVNSASLAYARDPDSYARLKALLGKKFDPARHRQGVDLAFGLNSREPDVLDLPVMNTLNKRRCGQPLIGINVSGLIANNASEAAARFGLVCDYRELMHQLLKVLLQETDANILLTPHVHATHGHYESDLDASFDLLHSLPLRLKQKAEQRVTIITQALDACELKWLIAQTDWFCGTRMHAAIAAVSSGVPCAALAYSPKFQGVFESCDVSDAVVDLRTSSTDSALKQLLLLWQQRDDYSQKLSERLPHIFRQVSRQLDTIVYSCRATHHQRKSASA